MQLNIFQNGITQVYLLQKAFYNLKQTFQVWYSTILDFFQKLDFYKTKIDDILFVSADKTLFIAIQVDDLNLFCADINFQINETV